MTTLVRRRSIPLASPATLAGRLAVAAPWLALAALTLLGLLLRRYRLAATGLWFDEADLIARARAPLADLLAAFVRPGENGPLYTLALAAWLRLAGDGEMAARAPAMLAGALAVPVLILLGRALGGWRVGLLAGGLLAISPYAIWYGQDAKMYALLTLLTPLTWLLLLQALRRNRPGWWVAYAVLTAVSYFTHVTSGLVWASQTLVVLLHWRSSPRGVRLSWLLTTLALLVPEWAISAWQAGYLLGDEPPATWHPALGVRDMLAVLLVKLAVNRADPTTELWGAWVVGGLALLGLLAWATGRVGAGGERPALRPAMALAAAVLVPVTGWALLSQRVPLFQDRYLIVVLPALLLLVAGAVAWLLRGRAWPLGLAGLTALLALAWVPLRDVVYAAEPRSEDWVGAYRFIDAHAREGDIIVLYPGYLRPTADYYARRLPALARLPIVTLPSLRDPEIGERDLDQMLGERTWGKTRVWLITSPERLETEDPRGLLRRWYRGNTRLFADRRFNGVRVETFSYNGPYKAGLWRPELVAQVPFGDEIMLFGASWDRLGPDRAARAGEWALLTLRWRALRPLTTSYVVRVRLRDAAGREVAAYDIAPLDGHYPTERWPVGEQIWDYHDLLIPADTPPGRHDVIVGLYPIGRPGDALRPASAAPGDPLGVNVGPLTVVR